MPANLARSDQFEVEILKQVDAYIARNGLDAPEEKVVQLRHGYEAPILLDLDLARAGIGSIVWAAGYRSDYTLIRLPILDSSGLLRARRGATDFRGLYFAGQPWQPSLKSAFLLGVGESTAGIAAQIVEEKAMPVAKAS